MLVSCSYFAIVLSERQLGLMGWFHSIVAWPDARNTATVRELRERAEGVEFKTPTGSVEGEEGVRALTGLPFR